MNFRFIEIFICHYFVSLSGRNGASGAGWGACLFSLGDTELISGEASMFIHMAGFSAMFCVCRCVCDMV